MGHKAAKILEVGKEEYTPSPLLAAPEELVPLMLPLHARSLCNFQQVSRRCANFLHGMWEKLYYKDFPLCYVQPENSDWRMHYKKTFLGDVTFLAQSYYKEQLVCRNAIARYKKYILFRTLIRCFGHESNEEQPATLEERLRPVPPNIRGLDSIEPQVYTPPLRWSEFLKPGDEIELQWGSMHYWWRGVVEEINGDALTMIFTQFKQNWHFYREVAVYGKKNGKCGGVRKIEEPETFAAWKSIFGERNLRMTMAAPDDFSGIGP